MELLRFFTAGNVDDGKSTLIGRLLYDSHSISTDIIETLTKQSKIVGADAAIDLALLTDGLRAEREQGITIDVAYKYFSTTKRKFIIADTPGHIQYTRNMFTGASNADLAIILIDARLGVTDQTKRHSIISALLRVPQVVVCVNKMDMVDYSEIVFSQIKSAYNEFANYLGLSNIHYIPTCAIAGDNIVNASSQMPWYQGLPLLAYLENVDIDRQEKSILARFQVQYVIRPQQLHHHDYRGYAGKISSGSYYKNQAVTILPSGMQTTIASIEMNQQEVEMAQAPQAVVLHLKEDIDISRGNAIVPSTALPNISNEVKAVICWMDNAPFVDGQKLLLQQGSFLTKAKIKQVISHIDIHTFRAQEGTNHMNLNDFCKVMIKTAENISYDAYSDNRLTGAFILINENTNQTVAAGMFE
jgi:sulfate adenylyltransferase subunit 1